MKQTLKIILGSALVTVALIKGAPALAEAPEAVNVSVIRTADLDLRSEAGQRTLDRRLVTAASEVCGTASDADLRGKNDVRECRDEVISAARAKARTLVAGAAGDRSITVAAVR